MDQFWEMYTAYKTKKPSERMKDTEWGRSDQVKSSVKVSDGQYFIQTGKGKQWLEHCTEAHIEVVGKLGQLRTILVSTLTAGCVGVFDTVSYSLVYFSTR